VTEPTLRIEHNLKPYIDGSGHMYRTSLKLVSGDREICLDDNTGKVMFPAEDWPLIRQTIDTLISFAATQDPFKEPQT